MLVQPVVCQMECNGEGVPTRISHPVFQQVAEQAKADGRDKYRLSPG